MFNGLEIYYAPCQRCVCNELMQVLEFKLVFFVFRSLDELLRATEGFLKANQNFNMFRPRKLI